MTTTGAPASRGDDLDPAARAGVLARVIRGALVESVHLGHLVVLDPAGGVRLAVGDPGLVLWPRSTLKPLQAVGVLRAGADLDPAGIALASASHSGEPGHLEVVRRVLASAGLTEHALRNTPTLPLDAEAAYAWRAAGHGAASVAQNCSGKHAAMLAACRAAGWPTEDYLDPGHPLQRALAATVAELTGDDAGLVTVDGCGAPLWATTLAGLARAYARLAGAPARAPGSPEARVAAAMSAHPWLVGGTGRDGTAAMAAVPGLVAKDGAEGVYAAGLPDGSALAFSVLDGAARPRPAILVAALLAAGVTDVPGADLAALRAAGRVEVLGGGRPVGEVVPAFGAGAVAERGVGSTGARR